MRMDTHLTSGAGWSRTLAVLLSMLLLAGATASAVTAPIDAQAAKQKVTARGEGNGIKVTLRDGSQMSGVITGIRDSDFDVVQKGMKQPTAVAYSQVVAVHNAGTSVGHKVGKGLMIGVVVAGCVAIAGVIVAMAGGGL